MQPVDSSLDTLLSAAVEIANDNERDAYLRRACGSDSSKMAELQSMVRDYFAAGSIIDRPAAVAPTLAAESTSNISRQIGPYKLRELLGEGGMGSVYVAEQAKPVRRKVALKIIKPGMGSREVISRFESERQALALMDHANIARILDGGATNSGQPYFVMELVRGIPITEYCDLHRLTTRARLEIFQQVCRAVQHAHQKGVIHRDIKPSNVLVAEIDGAAVPKVIDFGVAKAINQTLTEHTVYTRFSQMVGTPLYMSPEQAGTGVVDIDTRSDVYSLGVLLYELLTGDTPFEREMLKQLSLDEMRRIIREQELPRPSLRVSTLKAELESTIAARRDCRPNTLASSLKGELDWIVMKALEKDRARRYESASALAADLQRYLNNEPVLACPPSAAYRFQKYARRHLAQVVTATAIATILLAATIVSSTLATWALKEQGIAGAHLVVAQTERAEAQRERVDALDARALAQRQEQLAKQQRDAADYDAYVANIRLAYSRWARGESSFKGLKAVIPQSARPDFRGWEWHFLRSQVHDELFSFPLQQDTFTWSSTGNKLATVDITGLINIWDMQTGLHDKSLSNCPGKILSLAWSSDGKYMAAGSDQKVLVIWDVESAARVRTLYDAAPVSNVDWNPDSIRLASSAEDGTIAIWDSRTGEKLLSLILNAGPVKALDWHPDGNLLLAGGSGNDVKVWNTSTPAEVVSWRISSGACASFSPDGNRLVFGHAPVSVVDFETRKIVSSFAEPGAYESSWSADGRWLASAIRDSVIRIWGVETGVTNRSIQRSDAFEAPVTWSPVGSLLASSSNGTVKVWDAAALGKNPTMLSTHGSAAAAVAFSPNGRNLLARAQNGLHRMWSVETGEELYSLQSGADWLSAISFCPDGKQYAVNGSIDGKSLVVIRETDTGKLLVEMLTSKDPVGALAWSPDGNVLAVSKTSDHFGTLHGYVELYDTSFGRMIAISSKSPGFCKSIAWNPAGTRLAVSGDLFESSIRIYDSSLREEHRVAGISRCLDWSPDGKQLANGGPGGNITIYDTATWMPIRVLEGHSSFVNAIDWHPRLPRIVSSSRDGTVRIFDTSSGRELLVLETHEKKLNRGHSQSVAWSPDGMRLATAGNDAIVRLWDASLADEYMKLHGDLRETAKDLVKQEEFQLALETLEQLRQLHPHEDELARQSQRVRWLIANQLAVDGKAVEANTIFDQLKAESAVVPDYRLYLPGRIFDAGKHEAAIAMAQKFVAEFPDVREYRDELGFLYETRVMQLFQAGQFAEGTIFLRKLAGEFHDRPDFRGQLAFEMARTGNFAETIAMLERLAQSFEAWADYRPTLASRLAAADEHEMAVTIYEQLVADHPDAREYQLLRESELARVLIADGKLEEAKVLLLKLSTQVSAGEPIAADSEQLIPLAIANLSDVVSLAYFGRARAADVRGEPVAAIRDYESAIEATPNQAKVHNNLAWLLATTPDSAHRDVDRAVVLASRATELDPNNAGFLNTLGVAQYRVGNWPVAVAALNKSVELGQGGDSHDYFFLAMARWHLDDKLAARTWYDQAVEWMDKNAPDEEDLRRFRAEAAELLGVKDELKSEIIESPPTPDSN